MRIIREIVRFLKALNRWFPPPPIPRPPERRIGHRRYWSDEEWGKFKEDTLRKHSK